MKPIRSFQHLYADGRECGLAKTNGQDYQEEETLKIMRILKVVVLLTMLASVAVPAAGGSQCDDRSGWFFLAAGETRAFKMRVTAGGFVSVFVTGDGATDLDVTVYDSR